MNHPLWDPRWILAAVLSNFVSETRRPGREIIMARLDFSYLPRENPCAQCANPIPAPDWIEAGPRRVSYLWRCRACDYRFEAVAFFEDQVTDGQALAA